MFGYNFGWNGCCNNDNGFNWLWIIIIVFIILFLFKNCDSHHS